MRPFLLVPSRPFQKKFGPSGWELQDIERQFPRAIFLTRKPPKKIWACSPPKKSPPPLFCPPPKKNPKTGETAEEGGLVKIWNLQKRSRRGMICFTGEKSPCSHYFHLDFPTSVEIRVLWVYFWVKSDFLIECMTLDEARASNGSVEIVQEKIPVDSVRVLRNKIRVCKVTVKECTPFCVIRMFLRMTDRACICVTGCPFQGTNPERSRMNNSGDPIVLPPKKTWGSYQIRRRGSWLGPAPPPPNPGWNKQRSLAWHLLLPLKVWAKKWYLGVLKKREIRNPV